MERTLFVRTRLKLTVVYTLGAALLLFLLLVSVQAALRSALIHQVAQDGRLAVTNVLPTMVVRGQRLSVDLGAFRDECQEAREIDPQTWVRVLDASGRVLAQAGPPGERTPGDLGQASSWSHTVGTVWSGRRPAGTVEVDISLEATDRTLAGLRRVATGVFPLTVLLGILAGWWFSGVALRPVEASYLRMRQFTANAAHDLRTPLTVLRGQSELLLGMDLADPVRTRLESIDEEARRLHRLTEDLLFLARNEDVQAVHRACDLVELVEDVARTATGLAIARSVDLVVAPLPDLAWCTGEPASLFRALLNLADNAIKFTPSGGEVGLALLPGARETWILEVCDTGCGITGEHLPRLFERFYQVDAQRASTGSGLGLAIVHAIVRSHRGTIQVESEPGRGSRFAITLPACKGGPETHGRSSRTCNGAMVHHG